MTTRICVLALCALISLIAISRPAHPAAPDPAKLEAAARALVDAPSHAGRGSWDIVGQRQPARLPLDHLGNLRAPPPPPMDAPQARKREMVRRMFLLMLAHR